VEFSENPVFSHSVAKNLFCELSEMFLPKQRIVFGKLFRCEIRGMFTVNCQWKSGKVNLEVLVFLVDIVDNSLNGGFY